MLKKENIEWAGVILGWFAILTQFVLIIQNRQADVLETIFRFFSFFTILTNSLVALYFTAQVLGKSRFPWKLFYKDGTITALTAFIFIVGLVYQVVLRPLWTPTGLQWLVDELLHSVIPVLMLGYWYARVKASDLQASILAKWILYPLGYAALILLRGHFSGFYPYPFLNVQEIGYIQTTINIGWIALLAITILGVLILFGKKITPRASD